VNYSFFETTDEAPRNVSTELKKEHLKIECKMMAAMNDKWIHHYFHGTGR
jgi:uncharacterized protein with HEPN domain